MACINMFNNDQQSLHSTMGPRISFSNDFADTQQPIKHHDIIYREPPVTSEFAFSVSDHCMISADEVFCKGKILPTKNTLKDQLLVDDDDDYVGLSPRLTKTTGRWRERFGLGLKRSQIPAKKADKQHGDCLGRIDETMTTLSFHTGDTVDMKGLYLQIGAPKHEESPGSYGFSDE